MLLTEVLYFYYRRDLFQGKDAYLLLSTPPAVRRVRHVAAASEGVPTESQRTPQSILKVCCLVVIKIDFSLLMQ